jgi:hypothetical protein
MLTQKPLFLPAKNFNTTTHTKKAKFQKKKNPKLNKIGVRSWLAYQKMQVFLYVSDLLRSHKVQSKEHMQKIKHFPLCF